MGVYCSLLLEKKVGNEWQFVGEESHFIHFIRGMYIPGFFDAFGTHILLKDQKSEQFDEYLEGSLYGYGISYCTEDDIKTIEKDYNEFIEEYNGAETDDVCDSKWLLKQFNVIREQYIDKYPNESFRVAWIIW